ncbi:Hypothetical predicted protein [Olea europaea subsp. europaea]|uniref:Uncharacterized protein n=1 Tax=Olea europaea subsp. europaea TaxID=158383 RepID=A0A8S0TIK2_OLEEU|nr:Hypothetical predicted protein [Olea europaea subsp. europaea]
MEVVKKWIQGAKSKLRNFYPRSPPPKVQDPPPPMLASNDNQNPLKNFDWTGPIISFCFTAAVGIAMLPPSQRETLPMIFFCVLVILAFSFMWVRKYVQSRYPNWAKRMELAGILCTSTVFFLGISMRFSLILKIFSWFIYILCLIVVILCN